MHVRSPLVFLALSALAACGGGGGGGGGGTAPVVKVEKWTPSGENQVDTVGQTLPNVIRVKVTEDGLAAAGYTVHFTGGNLGTSSMVTGSNGIATSTWTLDSVAGPQTVTVTVDGAEGSPLTFHATAVPAEPSQLIYAGPSTNFAADTGQIFAGFAVKITDLFGNGIPGRFVQWSRTGPITLSTDSIITLADGTSTMFGTAGTTEGAITVTAAVSGLTGSPRTFTGAVVAAPVTITVASNFFSPDSISVASGAAIRWVWANGTHSVTSTGGPGFTGSDTQSAPFTLGPILFTTPGVYTYECVLHPSTMKGKIVVN